MKARRWSGYPYYDSGVVIVNGRRLVCGTGELPGDFPDRLCRLKEHIDLSWNGFCEVIGSDGKQVLRWRQGAQPRGGAVYSIIQVSAQVPGGLDLVMGEGFQASLAEL